MIVPHVIIVGGGFGGLSAVRALRSAAVRVTLLDKRNYHLFRPMLYQVATGLLSDDEISGPLRSILSHQKNVDVLLDDVTGVSPMQRVVHLKHSDLAYDFLILATGIRATDDDHRLPLAEIRLDLGRVGSNGADACNVVTFLEGWDRVDV